MTLEEVLQNVDPRWHEQFVRFVDSGEASDEFLQFLDTDEPCQQAVETAFQVQAAGVAKAVAALRRRDDAQTFPGDVAMAAPVRLVADALHTLIDTPAPDRTPILRAAVSKVKADLDPADQLALEAVVSRMNSEVAGAGR